MEDQKRLLQSILDSLGDGVIVADENGRVVIWNPAAERMFGAISSDIPLAAWPEHFGLHQADESLLTAAEFPLARTLLGEQIQQAEVRIGGSQADSSWVEITGRPLRDRLGAICGGVIDCRDISERKRADKRREALHSVTRLLSEGDAFEAIAGNILQILGTSLGCEVGIVWLAQEGQRLHCLEVWQAPHGACTQFADWNRGRTLQCGERLAGRVWRSGQAETVRIQEQEPNVERGLLAKQEGLRGGFAFPICHGELTLGVLELFSRRATTLDDDLVAMMAALGSQMGQLLQRQQVEKALRDSETLYHSLVECLPQNILRKDSQGRFTFGNQRYCASLDLTQKELIGKTDFDFFPPELARKYVADDQRVLNSGGTFETEEAHRLPDGSRLYVRTVKTPVRDAIGNIIGTQCIFWDETARHLAAEALEKSERRYRKLIESSQDGIIVANSDGNITLINPAAQRLFGHNVGAAIGQSVSLLIPEEFQTAHWAGFQRYLDTRVPHIIGSPVEIRGRRSDGSEFPAEIVISVLEADDDSHPRAVQFLCTVRDLTERNKMHAALVQNEKLASIGLLSAGVAHEINNPLAFVANNLVVLDRECIGIMKLIECFESSRHALAASAPGVAAEMNVLAEEVDLDYLRNNLPRLLARTRDGVDRVTRTVHSLRGLARTDTPKRTDTFLPDLVDNCVEVLRGRMKKNNIALEICHDPDPRVPCVSTQINQVILNLLVNAVQAIESKGEPNGKIVVTSQRNATEMMLAVSDNGCGIDEANLPRLFDPFFTTKAVGEGTGLGLTISHNIIEAHGGRFDIESTAGKGTCFRLYIPFEQPTGGRARVAEVARAL